MKKKNLVFKVGDLVKVRSEPTWGTKKEEGYRRPTRNVKAGDVVKVKFCWGDGDYSVEPTIPDDTVTSIVHQRHLDFAPAAITAAVNKAALLGPVVSISTPDLTLSSDGSVTLTSPAPVKLKKWTWAEVQVGDIVTAQTCQRRVGVAGEEIVTRCDTVDYSEKKSGHHGGEYPSDLTWGNLNLSISRRYDSWTITKVERPDSEKKVKPLWERRVPRRVRVTRSVPASGAWDSYTLHADGSRAVVEAGQVLYLDAKGEIEKKLTLKTTDRVYVAWGTVVDGPNRDANLEISTHYAE